MAKVEKFESRKKREKLAAHLALAAADETPLQEDCMDSEELADIAAGVCTPERREQAIAHFASCRKCYDNWVAISFSLAAMERSSAPVRRSLVTVRNLGYLGSAFAIAASVVVFLNIRDGGLESQPVPSPPSETSISSESREVAFEKEKVVGGVMEKKTTVQKDAAAPGMPAATQQAGAGRVEDHGALPDKAPVHRKAEHGTLTAEGEGEALSGRVFSKSEVLPEKRSSVAPEPTMLESGDWLEHVYEVCGNPPGEQAFWKQLHEDGKKVLDLPAAGGGQISAARKKTITEVLNLLATISEPGQVGRQCDKIRTFLAQELDKE